VNNSDFQKLASIRLEEAQILLETNHYAGAYYLAGYVIECALKAIIASKTRAGEFPPKPEIVRDFYTHDLKGLIKLAGLSDKFQEQCALAIEFDENWETVKAWTEHSRYETKIDSDKADKLLRAVSDGNGVLQWLTQFW
jgi:HEPN domain-containing protein